MNVGKESEEGEEGDDAEEDQGRVVKIRNEQGDARGKQAAAVGRNERGGRRRKDAEGGERSVKSTLEIKYTEVGRCDDLNRNV